MHRLRNDGLSRVVQRLSLRTAILAIFGFVLLANPLYLGRFSTYPLVEWADMPLFVAGVTVLGLLCLGVFGIALLGLLDDPRIVFVVGLLSVPGFALYNALLPFVWQPPVDPISGFFYTQLFIGSLVAGAFVAGGVGRVRKTWGVGGALAVVIPFLTLYLVDWGFAAQLEPIVDLYTFLTDNRLLGVSYVGSGIVLAAFLLGLGTPVFDKNED